MGQATTSHSATASALAVKMPVLPQVLAITPPTLTQSRFRWRNDDGSETGATWAAAENTNISAPLG